MKKLFQNKRVLVTGAGGFIGSHLVEALVAHGAKVRALVRYNSKGDLGFVGRFKESVLSEIEVHTGDLRDLSAVQRAVKGSTHVFHLGALIAIPFSYKNPQEVVETNVLGTLNVLLASEEAKVERIIHTSTSEVYGTAMTVPIDEQHPLQGQSPYSASKIGADKMAESFYCSYKLPVVTLRPFNTYGPRQSARAVIPTIITQALTRKTIRLGNLDARRDMTYVSDTVNGFLKVAQAEGVEGQVFNLGTGTEVTVRELADRIVHLVGCKARIVVDDHRFRPAKSEVQRLLSNNGKAADMLGWKPLVSLEQGLSKTIEWIRNNLERYRPNEYQI